MDIVFSIIVPVYNRPNEVDELLRSLTLQTFAHPFEVIVVEDGSTEKSEAIVAGYKSQLQLRYFYTHNQGAGKSRNFGMQKALGNYFVIFDSDCIIPEQYLEIVYQKLNKNYTDAFGGPDAAHDSFTNIQKAINYSMTSLLTTGGIRGKNKSVGRFQPRSFNLGISKKAFEKTQGFSDLKVGEDIDLTFRLWEAGFQTQLLVDAFVYHKRRTTLQQFYKQTHAFGSARPFLNKRFPGTAKITYLFPSFFLLGLLGTFLLSYLGIFIGVIVYAIYYIALFLVVFQQSKSLKVALLSIATTSVQFYGYGTGFIKGLLKKY
ncbi:MAG: glycosyltransferase [Flavicella sp.]